ncbi:tryptophan-rich sensory protein [Kovacikia minuta CCNUW1]|uniref:tryptophan-rich sensory protein n=1 Tax=Kovacikia minuta TaxID=2931930 RepID=UPI001CCFC66C|nr:TspO/MBR family protein [Kovacikia minuta]UBF28831.1 tryptophan-rich sensory protein [Kovacikia minuta CCNUW1]
MKRNKRAATAHLTRSDSLLDAPGGAIAFALGTLLLGFLAAWVGFTFVPPVPPYRQLPFLYPPLWFFWAVWLVIYPSWGVATWLVSRKHAVADVRGVLALYVITLMGNTLFLPIGNLSGGNPAVLSLMDANGVFSSWVMFWLYTRYSKRAGWFLLPLLIWMPLTFLLKLWLWQLNR